MADEQIFDRIEALVKEEHELQHRAENSQGLDEDAHSRMKEVEVQLDQCWDLLRQRRARRGAGQDPDDAQVRSGDTVEHYLQ
jgi:hypothetical protein